MRPQHGTAPRDYRLTSRTNAGCEGAWYRLRIGPVGTRAGESPLPETEIGRFHNCLHCRAALLDMSAERTGFGSYQESIPVLPQGYYSDAGAELQV
jgi:hypothetical protein